MTHSGSSSGTKIGFFEKCLGSTRDFRGRFLCNRLSLWRGSRMVLLILPDVFSLPPPPANHTAGYPPPSSNDQWRVGRGYPPHCSSSAGRRWWRGYPPHNAAAVVGRRLRGGTPPHPCSRQCGGVPPPTRLPRTCCPVSVFRFPGSNFQFPVLCFPVSSFLAT